MEQLQGKLCRMCRWKIIIIELPDGAWRIYKQQSVCRGVDSIDQGQKDSLVKDGSKLACAIKKRFSNNMFSRTSNLYVCFYNEIRWRAMGLWKRAKDFNALPCQA
jgi:hypothetical protein